MLLSAVSVFVVAQSSSEIPEGLMNNTLHYTSRNYTISIKAWRDSLPVDMLLSAVSVFVVAQSSLEIPEGLMNNTVHYTSRNYTISIKAQRRYNSSCF